MNSLRLNIYNYKIEIKSADFPLKHLKINADFSFFTAEDTAPAQLHIKIAKLPLFAKAGFKIGQTPMCEVRQVSFNKRQLIYSNLNRTLAVVNDESHGFIRHIDVLAENPEIIDDILYFLINSCAGEYLDAHGLVRIHALSFKSPSGTHLVYGASQAGKSRLALELLKNPHIQIYSDEVSLFDLDKKLLLPYPIRVSSDELLTNSSITKFTYFFNSKGLMAIEPGRIATPSSLNKLYFLKKTSSLATLRKAQPWEYAGFKASLILGLGLIQMWEFLLRLNNLNVLFKIFKNRLKLVFYIASYDLKILNREHSLDKKLNSFL